MNTNSRAHVEEHFKFEFVGDKSIANNPGFRRHWHLMATIDRPSVPVENRAAFDAETMAVHDLLVSHCRGDVQCALDMMNVMSYLQSNVKGGTRTMLFDLLGELDMDHKFFNKVNAKYCGHFPVRTIAFMLAAAHGIVSPETLERMEESEEVLNGVFDWTKDVQELLTVYPQLKWKDEYATTSWTVSFPRPN